MSDVDVIDLVKYASENKPVDFTTALNNILGQKALDALADRKQEIAANLFRDNDSEETEEEQTDEPVDQTSDDDVNTEEDEVDPSDEETEETGETDDQP